MQLQKAVTIVDRYLLNQQLLIPANTKLIDKICQVYLLYSGGTNYLLKHDLTLQQHFCLTRFQEILLTYSAVRGQGEFSCACSVFIIVLTSGRLRFFPMHFLQWETEQGKFSNLPSQLNAITVTCETHATHTTQLKQFMQLVQVVVTIESARAIDQLRRACEGHGLIASSNLPCKGCFFSPKLFRFISSHKV